MKSIEFKPGDRVRLNNLGVLRSPKSKVRKGVVAATGPGSLSTSLSVLFDGNKRPTKVHSSYVDLDSNGVH